ncbi:ATP-binding protein [Propionivibrio sp.]|uniref:sensor histidine kinase n=1 Tax=Propionivibrio sp. TaxID=2212460 RepID=UPI0025E462E2|nr:ATP-binding protein [Propionivibrio sp.]MBK8743497.1 sensor histidine kinase [Propionivibrio sp.]
MSTPLQSASPHEHVWGWLGARILISIAICVLVGWCVQKWMLERQIDSFAQQSRPRADFYRLSLESLLSRNESLPRILAMSEQLKALLKRPDNKILQDGANSYLLSVKHGADINAVYLLNRKGLTLASSNYALESSFVGKNYGYRPYFREAVETGFGRFYGIGVTTGEPGYFLAAPIKDKGEIIGAVAVKISLDDFESAFTRSGDLVLLVDAYGVIFLTSVPKWKYHTLAPLDAEAKRQLEASRQYYDVLQPPLKIKLRLQEEHQSIRIALPGTPAQDYLIQSVPTGTLGWSIVLLTPTRQEHQNALLAGAVAGFALALLFSTLIFFRLSIRRYKERRMAEARMQQEYRELENRIAERTTDLLAANLSLGDKIEALKSTESILRETRDSAVQAGKLAVLGQMAAGISHEVNQPLTALHTYTDNAVSLLEMGRLTDVRENLGFIKQMAVRMGKIVGEIKTFARKPTVERLEVRVGDVIRQAVMLVDTRRRQVGAQIDVAPIDDGLMVWADLQRLEQVIVNLLLNSLDSVAEASEKHIEVCVTNENSHVRITIIDHGPGIAADVLPRLFEPFFTTKTSGQGLGLGLAISRMIVAELGGRIDARNLEPCGAEFTVVLEKA